MAYPKGKPKSEESKRKTSESCRAAWTEEKRLARSRAYSGEGNSFYGRKHTNESRMRMVEAHKEQVISDTHRERLRWRMLGNQFAKGNHYSLTTEQRAHLSEIKHGEKSYLWKGGISPEDQRIRGFFAYRE